MFALFLTRFVHGLRPVAVAELLAKGVRQSLGDDIADMRGVGDIFVGPPEGMDESPALAGRWAGPGAIQAVNLSRAVTWARQHECLWVMRHSVGDFVEAGDLPFEVYDNPGQADAAEGVLRGLVAPGLERTIEQDPAFALRVMADVANKALSPAVNNPTTAVQVLDYLGDSLLLIGETDRSEPSWHTGAAKRGVVAPVGRWEEFRSASGTWEPTVSQPGCSGGLNLNSNISQQYAQRACR